MPDNPADKKAVMRKNDTEPPIERLATPEELAEFGGVPNPDQEAEILALLEEQMAEETEELAADAEHYFSEFAPASKEEKSAAAEEPKLLPEVSSAAITDADASVDGEPVRSEVEEPRYLRESDAEPQVQHADLLELAVVLDQHRLWVESAGKNGARGDFSGAALACADLTGVTLQGALMQKANLRGADLSMANLRGANLVEADLRETNLLGTEFSGANLMGANLYGAQGLWAGRLGGTNLFDATLPEAVSASDGGKAISQSTQAVRRFYLFVMVICLAACALIALTTDVRLLLDESATVIARIPNLLPLQGFYLGAPLLLTVLYLRMQFLFLRLWGSVGALPAVFPDGQTPEKDGPWYVMGPIRSHLRWTRDPRSPLAIVESVMAKLLAYWAVPATLFFFWLRYLVMQDYRGTLLQVFLFTLVGAIACGLPQIVARMLRPGDWADESTPKFVRDVARALRAPVAAGIALFVLSIGVIHGLPYDPRVRPDVAASSPRRWAATGFHWLGYRPFADISEESVSTLPAAENPGQTSESEATGPRLNEINLRYARGYHAAFANARMWRANLEGASLSDADFRGVNLREGVLRMARLDRLQAAKANLVSADAEGATFAGADFRNADLSYANLEGAILTTVDLTRATVYAANMQHANLLRAVLSNADLRDVKLEGSVLSLARLEQTDLSAAKLAGANLTGVDAKGTIFLEADLSKADLRGGTFTGAVLRQTKLEGARLEGADFRGALGLEGWQVCSAQGWRGAQFDPDVKAAAEQACGAAAVANPNPQ
jgi:uncharacterized protein YjbI with pentapeptide repeats